MGRMKPVNNVLDNKLESFRKVSLTDDGRESLNGEEKMLAMVALRYWLTSPSDEAVEWRKHAPTNECAAHLVAYTALGSELEHQ